MIQPEHLQKVVREGYGETKTVHRNVLEEIDFPCVESQHNTMGSAIEEISRNSEKLKHCQLTIIPVISVSWDGSVS